LTLCREAVPAAVLAYAETKPRAVPADSASSGYDWRRVKSSRIDVGKTKRCGAAVTAGQALGCHLVLCCRASSACLCASYRLRSVEAVQQRLSVALVKERLGAALIDTAHVDGLHVAMQAVAQVRAWHTCAFLCACT
jgi:hypothetical protein